MQDLTPGEIQKEINELKKNIPNYKPISAHGRLAICEECPERSDVGKKIYYCRECGCLLALKVRFPLTSCPLGKW